MYGGKHEPALRQVDPVSSWWRLSMEQPSVGRTTRLRVGITLYGWCLLSAQPGETGLWGRR